MKDLNRKALIYSVLGVISVLAVALVTDFLAPQSSFGEVLRFSIPIIAGIISGAAIFFKLKDESDIDFKEIGEEE
jgi:hypothetical protein